MFNEIQALEKLLEKARKSEKPNRLTKAKMIERISAHRAMTNQEKRSLTYCHYNKLLEIWLAVTGAERWENISYDWEPYKSRFR